MTAVVVALVLCGPPIYRIGYTRGRAHANARPTSASNG